MAGRVANHSKLDKRMSAGILCRSRTQVNALRSARLMRSGWVCGARGSAETTGPMEGNLCVGDKHNRAQQ